MIDAFTGAVDEVAWRFTRAESAIGIRGQSYAESGSGHVFDTNEDFRDESNASARMHLGRRAPAFRHAVQKMQKADLTLAACGRFHADRLRLAFTPFGRASAKLLSTFLVSYTPDVKISHVGVALRTHSARVAFGRAHDTMVEPGDVMMLRWLEGMGKDVPGRTVLERVREEANAEVRESLDVYAEHFQARRDMEHALRREESEKRSAEYDRGFEERESKRRERIAAHVPALAALREIVAQGRHLSLVGGDPVGSAAE